MNVYADQSRAQSVQNWAVTISCVFVSLSGVILALICIFSIPDKSTQPLIGSIFFSASALLLIALVLFLRRNIRRSQISQPTEAENTDSNNVIFRETISDKILKWVINLFSLFFAYCGVLLGLICIYSLPDKSVQPALGAIYFLGSAWLVSTFIYAVWKKR